MSILLLFLCFFILLFVILFIIMASKIRKLSVQSRNKVHFYVTCEVNYHRGGIIRALWFGKPIYTEDKSFAPDKVKQSHILDILPSVSYKLNYFDFDDMKEGEIREVFLSTED